MTISRTELEKIVRQLEGILATLKAEIDPVDVPPEIAAEVKRKMDEGICLAWDHPIGDEPSIRGLCETDYHTTMARIRRGEENEVELMQQGKLGPRSKPGRKAAKDLAAEKAAKQKKVAEDLEAYKKRKAKGKADE